MIRCSEFDTHVVLTEKGIDTVVRELGIRTEIDQRGEAVGKITQSVLSPYGVCWHLLPMMPYTAIFEQDTKDSLVRAFAILSDPDSYPLCFHCWGGADRGGTLAFLIEAALGVSESDLHLDYELTSLSIWNIRTRNYGEYANMVERLRAFAPGQPLSAAVRAYLYSIGVKKSDVEGMRRILVGYPK